jgi:hypothetical protein
VRELYRRLRRIERQQQGRPAEPSAGIIDAQSVDGADTVAADSRGYDDANYLGSSVMSGRPIRAGGRRCRGGVAGDNYRFSRKLSWLSVGR